MSDFDSIHRFVFENAAVRGELVQLQTSWQALLETHAYPDVVCSQLGQGIAASALLAATIKYKGSLILQVQSDGPLTLLVAQSTSAKTFRGMAHWKGEVSEGDIVSMYGSGRLVMTLEPAVEGERYQGVVALEGDKLADALRTYFTQSEQLETQLWLAANGERAVGLLVQKLPGEAEDKDAWSRVKALAATITDEELLSLSAEEVLHRLFHEENVRLFESERLSFQCGCSRDKVATALLAMGKDEVDSIIEEEGKVQADCEFCNRHYEFDRVDVEGLFSSGSHDSLPSKH